jgi:hypothetical protein
MRPLRRPTLRDHHQHRPGTTAHELGCAAAAHFHLQQGFAERGRDVCGEFECGHLRQLFEGLAGAGHRQPLQLVLLPRGSSAATPNPESTDNFDLGVRYRSGKLMAQVSTWYTIYQNRLASTFDRDLNTTIYRNLGRVDKYGIDGSISYSRYATWRSISMARTCTPRFATTWKRVTARCKMPSWACMVAPSSHGRRALLLWHGLLPDRRQA